MSEQEKISDIMSDEKFLNYVIDRCITFPSILKQIDCYASYDHNFYCPFHDNTDTPSARAFRNDDGDTIYCYSEGKVFRPHHVLDYELINVKKDKVFFRIWKKLDKSQQDELIATYGNKADYIPEKWRDSKEELNKFKRGEVSYSEFMAILSEALE